jgi:pSer/pThr/pTyr-binding forkhead associated (FHA) protein
MTAVAPPVQSFQNINRQAWSAEGGANGAMYMPRKSAQRTNSSSSLSSQASSTSTISAASTQSQPNGAAPQNGTDASSWAARKTKGPKGLYPATKTEPVAGLSIARPQQIATAGPGASAASAMSALQAPSAMVPSQQNGVLQSQQNGVQRAESTAILHLIPMNGTFERKTITVPFFPDVLRIGRQTNNKTIPTPLNGYFDSKVLSRQHAEVWADRNGKIWIRDVKSSNGTFVNGQRLSQENRDSDPHELREQDMLELGIDIVSEDQKTIVHHKVAARVEHAGIYARSPNDSLDMSFGEMDGNQMVNMMGANGQQQMQNMRGRTPSQGSMNGQRMQMQNGVQAYQNAMQQPRQPQFWLQPITIEQVVKKLNVSAFRSHNLPVLILAGGDESRQAAITRAAAGSQLY